MIPPGSYNAIASGIETGHSKTKNTPYVRVKYRILDGPCQSEVVEWTGWKTDKGKPYAERALRTAGWHGDWNDIVLPNPVQVVVEHEEYPPGSGKKYARVRWVNDVPPGFSAPPEPEEFGNDDIPF